MQRFRTYRNPLKTLEREWLVGVSRDFFKSQILNFTVVSLCRYHPVKYGKSNEFRVSNWVVIQLTRVYRLMRDPTMYSYPGKRKYLKYNLG